MQRGRANPFQNHSHAATSAAQDKLALLFSQPQDIMFRGHYDSVSWAGGVLVKQLIGAPGSLYSEERGQMDHDESTG